MKQRDDLLYLSPEALTQATNAGIVKRAVRELDKGYQPELTLLEDGTLSSVFEDGICCTWPLDVSIDNALCTCAAAKTCRHRVITALAYRSSVLDDEEQHDASTTPAGVATVNVDKLQEFVSAQTLTQARRQQKSGITIGLHFKGAGEPCDTARLPSATVRFWGGASLNSARCDCVQQTACEHIVLGVWAFQSLLANQPRETQNKKNLEHKVTLGGEVRRTGPDTTAFNTLVNTLVLDGVANGAESIAQSLSAAQISAAESGAAWLETLLADVENWSTAYVQRSNLYEPLKGCSLIAELGLRLSASSQAEREQDAIGTGLSGVTALDTLRLNALGSRIRRDGDKRMAMVVMADADTGSPMVVECSWQVAADQPKQQPDREITQRDLARVAPGVHISPLAHGQLLSKSANRYPNGTVQLARSRRDKNNLLPQLADWNRFTRPVRYDSVVDLKTALRVRPVPSVEPRHAARRFVIFSPANTQTPSYDPNHQCLHTIVYDNDNQPVLLERYYERHTPTALPAMASATLGHYGKIKHVAGMLNWRQGLACIEPWSFACENGFIVPDFAKDTSADNKNALSQVELAGSPLQQDSVAGAQLTKLGDMMGTILHNGISQLPAGWPKGAQALVHSLATTGLHELANEFNHLSQHVLVQSAKTPGSKNTAPGKEVMRVLALWQLHLDAISYGNIDIGTHG